MLHGWIILDKPLGMGSTTAVAALKHILRSAGEPKAKIGHGGTLDPLASGVLPIAIGEATKLCGRMLETSKSYDFTIAFGEETDTLDREGKIVAVSQVRPSRTDVAAILPLFTGEIEQVPPAFSALKIDGKPAYKRVRAGETLAMKARRVTVHRLAVPNEIDKDKRLSGECLVDGAQECHPGVDKLALRTTVSKGTYIRSLARDIAYALGTVGHISTLRRTRAGPFTLEQAISLDFIEEAAKARALTRMVLPLETALDDIPALPVTPEQAQLLRHGQKLAGFPAKPGLGLAMLEKIPVALVEASDDGLTVVRGFNL